MKFRIFVYPMETPVSEFELPEGSKFLTVKTRKELPALYFLIPENTVKTQKRKFMSVATGDPLDSNGMAYLGTIKCKGEENNEMFWHIFEVINKAK